MLTAPTQLLCMLSSYFYRALDIGNIILALLHKQQPYTLETQLHFGHKNLTELLKISVFIMLARFFEMTDKIRGACEELHYTNNYVVSIKFPNF